MVNDLLTILKEETESPFKPATPSDLKNREAEAARQEKEDQDKRERERIAREEETAKKQAVISKKLQKVLKLLGMTAVKKGEWGVRWYGENEAGEKIDLSLMSQGSGRRYGEDRISVSGTYPTARGSNYTGRVHIKTPEGAYQELNRTNITLSAEKTPELIAKEIQRRFMPGHQKYHAAAKAIATDTDAYEDLTIATLTDIKGASLGEYEAREKQITGVFRGDDVYGSVKASGASARIEVSGLTADQVKKIAAIVNRSSARGK